MKSIEEIKEYRDVLIEQLRDEKFINESSISAYHNNMNKLIKCLTEIKEMSKKIKSFSGEYRWLSNFWNKNVLIEYKGITFTSNENFYQAMKTKDIDKRIEISKMTEAEAKAEGKWIEKSHMFRDNWDSIKENVMLYGLRQKFSNPILKQKLIDTEDMVIEEGNTWSDKFWGICLKTGEGENKLGKLLMKVRSELKNEK
jgi:ribA/ribD-fused uncharacterized protein